MYVCMSKDIVYVCMYVCVEIHIHIDAFNAYLPVDLFIYILFMLEFAFLLYSFIHVYIYTYMRRYFHSERPDLSWSTIEQRIRTLVYELFSNLGESIGSWPSSTAYYAIDVILDDESGIDVQPKLIEVNFLGDWHGPEVVFGVDKYMQWAADVFNCMVRDEGDFCVDRLWRLGEEEERSAT